MRKVLLIVVTVISLVLIGCASNNNEPSVDDITNRLTDEYVGLSFDVFTHNNGEPKSKIVDTISNTTVYTWQSPSNSYSCEILIDVSTTTNIIKKLIIVHSDTDQVDEYWMFWHKYVQACKMIK